MHAAASCASRAARAAARPWSRRRAALPRAAPLSVTAETVNPHLRAMEYAVRGELVLRAGQYKKELEAGRGQDLPFRSVLECNIGNPQQVGQKPLTFPRQVLALTTYPDLMDQPAAAGLFPEDAVARARKYLARIGSTGAYSESKGVAVVREEVAAFVAARDGHEASPDDIFLTDGASPGAKYVLQLAIRGPADGIMIPIPQYPLYSATVAGCDGSAVGYYLDEDAGWSMTGAELQRAYDEAKAGGVTPRVLVVINPGNPTGQCLTAESVREVVEFARRNDVLLLADEVYQANTYSDVPFTSFNKVVCDEGADDVALVSLHSVSKGFLGECGRRGGYFHLTNVDEGLRAELLKLASVSLCSNLDGQLMTGLMVNPPREGEPSHELYQREMNDQLDSLKRRAVRVAEGLNALEGVSCQPVQGAMYAFPRIELPLGAVEAAREAGKTPDTFYCLELLANTGVVTVPGSGFRQRDGTFHLRTTILPLENEIDDVIARMAKFHAEFLARYQ